MLGYRGRSAYAVGVSVIALSTVFANTARADLESVVEFNVPAANLDVALTTISRQGRVMISFASEVAAGRQAGAFQGRTTVRSALQRVLSGTGLKLAVMPDGSVTVVPGSVTATGSTASGDMAVIDVTDGSAAGSRYQDDGFQAGDGGTTIRLPNTSAKEVPQTVSVVTNQVLKTQGITTATDAVQNVAGVSILSSDFGVPVFTIRGFQSKGLYANGMASSGFGQVPIDDVDRVEVLKGPTSILTGNTLNGGVVNLTTKAPTSQVIQDVTVRYGSFNYKTLAFDFGGPIAGTEGLTYRLNMSGNTADQNYAGYKNPHEYLMSPVVKWENNDTSVQLGLRYYDQRLVQNQNTFVPTTNLVEAHPILRIPSGLAQVNPNLGVNSSTLTLYSDVSHKIGTLFGLDVTANNHFQYLTSSAIAQTYAWTGTSNTRFPGTYRAIQTYTPYEYGSVSNRADLTLTYDAGFARQVSKFGFDYRFLSYNAQTNTSGVYNINPYTSTYVDLFSSGITSATIYNTLKNKDIGLYYLEKFDTLNDRLHITGQIRHDDYSYNTISGVYGNQTPIRGAQAGLSWFVGAAYDVTPYFTAYGNRTHGLFSNGGINAATKAPLPPEERDQTEFGGRYFLFDKKLTLTTTYFELTAINSSISSGQLPDITYFLVPGMQSKGFEFEAQGQVLPGLNLIASFAAVRAKFQSSLYGNTTPGIPMYTGSFWGTYTFQDVPLRGLTIGAGMHAFSDSVVAASITGDGSLYKVPGAVTADAMIAYEFDKWALQFKLNNIFNKYYYSPVAQSNPITISQGRTFLLTAKYSFN